LPDMKKILIFAEPYPLRNAFTDYYLAATVMISMVSSLGAGDAEWKIYSNSEVCSRIPIDDYEGNHVIFPTEDEEEFFRAGLREWNDTEVDRRSALIRGEGEVAGKCVQILERIHSEFDFDVILLWSENGAVTRFVRERDVVALYMELGPTRAPFPKSMYIDIRGTNGSVSFLDFNIASYPADLVIPAETWLAASATAQAKDTPSIVELKCGFPNLPAACKTPYVVVALQLFDDLNTIFHSKFRTPKEFLEYILPKLQQHGYHIIVKGHPGASARPNNLMYEVEAIEFARNFSDKVHILPRTTSPQEFIPLLSNAVAVCSINSSVSFEALLLGTPGLVFGDAVYDIGLSLKTASEAFLATGKWNFSQFQTDRLVTVMFRHFLLPEPVEQAANRVQRIIKGVFPDMSGEEYSNMLLCDREVSLVSLEEEIARIELSRNVHTLLSTSKRVSGECFGYIDEISKSGEAQVYNLRGWVAAQHNVGPILKIVAVSVNGEILSWAQLASRDDVAKAFPRNFTTGFEFRFGSTGSRSTDEIVLLFFTPHQVYSANMKAGRLSKEKLVVKLRRKAEKLLGEIFW